MPSGSASKDPRAAFKPPRPLGATRLPAASSASAKDIPQASKPSTSERQPAQLSSLSQGSSACNTLNNTLEKYALQWTSSDDENDRLPKTATTDTGDLAIPPKLLTRLLHEFFENATTRITKEASAVVAKYMETFVKEAIARAVQERRESGRDAGFLEVEDLEKLAPQMLLDF